MKIVHGSLKIFHALAFSVDTLYACLVNIGQRKRTEHSDIHITQHCY